MTRRRILGLGIDTGGTYTDAVVFDMAAHRVLTKAKALTTRPDPLGGILAAVDSLGLDDTSQIRIVGLSTTLATNAVVESRFAPAGLLLLGFPPATASRIDHAPVRCVKGFIDIQGHELLPLDKEGFSRALEDMLSAHPEVQALAIAGYCATMNPAHELQAMELAGQITDMPIVAAHHLSSRLNAIRRATTAVLNASLLPLIARLVRSVKEALTSRDIQAPLCIVKADGSVLSADAARLRPVETILSGPAASIVGATHLAGTVDPEAINHALLVDMGGTTTDIAAIRDGRAVFTTRGAVVGTHETHVQAPAILTVGLGGDSYVRIVRNTLTIGPQRVVPLCIVAHHWPAIVERLRKLLDDHAPLDRLCQPADCFMLLDDSSRAVHETAHTEAIVEALRDGPLYQDDLATRTGVIHASLLRIESLERAGVVIRCGMTPTDAMHVLGRFQDFNADASDLAARLYGRLLGMHARDVSQMIARMVPQQVACHVVRAALATDGQDDPTSQDDQFVQRIGSYLFDNESRSVQVRVKLDQPLIAMGAPAETYLPATAAHLESSCLVVPHAEVANAVGAVVGQVVCTVRASISQDLRGLYLVHADVACEPFTDLDQARTFVTEHVRLAAHTQAVEAGAHNPHVEVTVDDRYGSAQTDAGAQDIYIETVVEARAAGRPHLDT